MQEQGRNNSETSVKFARISNSSVQHENKISRPTVFI